MTTPTATATPSARMLLDYVADVTLVTVADVAAYFGLSLDVAAECVAKVGLVSPDADGTFEIDPAYSGDPDDALDAFLDRHGVDYPDTPLADVPEGSSGAKAPVTVRDAEPREPGFRIPPPPASEPDVEPDVEAPRPRRFVPSVDTLAAEIAALRAELASLRAEVAELRAGRVEAPAKPSKPTAPKRERKSTKKSPSKRMTLPAMVKAGLVEIGDEIALQGATATLAENRCVVLPDGSVERMNAWAIAVTGWKSVNVYENVTHVPSGKTLEALRSEATV